MELSAFVVLLAVAAGVGVLSWARREARIIVARAVRVREAAQRRERLSVRLLASAIGAARAAGIIR